MMRHVEWSRVGEGITTSGPPAMLNAILFSIFRMVISIENSKQKQTFLKLFRLRVKEAVSKPRRIVSTEHSDCVRVLLVLITFKGSDLQTISRKFQISDGKFKNLILNC